MNSSVLAGNITRQRKGILLSGVFVPVTSAGREDILLDRANPGKPCTLRGVELLCQSE